DAARRLPGARAVVQGARPRVGRGCPGEIQPPHHVRHALPPVPRLLLAHPVPAAPPQSGQRDAIAHGPPRTHASATRTASKEGRTECTRTPHAPLTAANAEMAVVASSRPLG